MLRAIIIAFLISILSCCGLEAKINRVRPPQNSEQYAREAARVRLENLVSKLGLSEEQLLKIRKAQLKKENDFKKQENKLNQKLQKFESEKAKIEQEEEKINLKYQQEFERCLTPEQRQKYLELIQKEKEEEAKLNSNNPTQTVCPEKSVCPEETEGSVGPIIKAPDPPILYQ